MRGRNVLPMRVQRSPPLWITIINCSLNSYLSTLMLDFIFSFGSSKNPLSLHGQPKVSSLVVPVGSASPFPYKTPQGTPGAEIQSMQVITLCVVVLSLLFCSILTRHLLSNRLCCLFLQFSFEKFSRSHQSVTFLKVAFSLLPTYFLFAFSLIPAYAQANLMFTFTFAAQNPTFASILDFDPFSA